jgi:integrase
MGTSHWVPFFEDALSNLTAEQIDEYTTERLSKVLAATVRKEHSGLRGLIAWASAPERGLMPFVEVPSLPKKAVGTKPERRTRSAAIEISPAEAKKILSLLPEWSSSPSVADKPHPIRARFIVQYETGLRPELIDRLSVPEHYRRGSKAITITRELDKNRWARPVPLSAAARKALDRVLPKDGVIFGNHRYETPLRRAARLAMPKDPERAKLFTGAHLRSARVTHWIDEGAPLTGIQYLVGHKHLETTAKYVRPSERAALSVLKRRAR